MQKIFHLYYLPAGCLAALLIARSTFAHDIDCDANFVALDDGVVTVDPTGVDDTDNIQCALDQAKAINAPTVKLASGQFYISHVQIADFNGALEGRKTDSTVVDVIDESVDCLGLLEGGQFPAALKFINGKPQLRTMSINVERACATRHEDFWGFYLVHFTGEDALSGCDAGTVHGLVDRVDLSTQTMPANNDTFTVGVAARAEGFEYEPITRVESCRIRQFGTLKVNRSRFLGPFASGVEMSLRASALVEVAFNEFLEIALDSITLRDAGQITSIQKNVFKSQFPGFGSHIRNFNFPEDYQPPIPGRNRIIIHDNQFTIGDPTGENWSAGPVHLRNQSHTVDGQPAEKPVVFSGVVTGNRFVMEGNNIHGVFGLETEGLIIADNVFQGSARYGVGMFAGDLDTLENTSITGNSFGDLETIPHSPGDAHIKLWERVNNSVVGPEQGATITDMGVNNLIGEQ